MGTFRYLSGSRIMNKPLPLPLSAVLTGSIASVVSTTALAALAKVERKSAVRPTNSTSNWLNGRNAGNYEGMDFAHTGIGLGTHYASALFWALPFEPLLAAYPPRTPSGILRNAVAMAAVAGVVDYGIVPKRLSPGWELTLSRKSIVWAFGSLAVGLAAGALVTRHVGRRTA